jgi:hypothetical protein
MSQRFGSCKFSPDEQHFVVNKGGVCQYCEEYVSEPVPQRVAPSAETAREWLTKRGFRDDVPYRLAAIAEILEEAYSSRLADATDICDCGHARHQHEYGAFGYNAASNCRKEECKCNWFAPPAVVSSRLAEKWIPVTERLPEEGREVIVFTPNSNRQKVKALARFIRYEGASEFFWDMAYTGKGRCHTENAVTHWMPLPAPPAASEGQGK